ncbi:MAG: class I SAM-dependent DNA methyltransferase, partial [Stenotrophobium sp.]
DLSIGANIASAGTLLSNQNLTSRGLMLFGAGFIVTTAEAENLTLIREYRNGKDLTERPRGVMVIDAFGLTAEQLREQHPAAYQWLLERVKPERDQNRDKGIRDNWWLHGRPRPELRSYLRGLTRYIATVETAKHRLFQFLDAAIAPDNKLIAIALGDATALGVLSSRVHVLWALASGSHLGVGNDPVYVKTRCFEPFPFPADTPAPAARIRALAEQIDAHRKRQQAQHASLTLTGLYNVLEKLRGGAALNPKEKTIHEQGLVGVLASLHDELDAAVLDAYGWADLAPALVGKPGGSLPLAQADAAQAAAQAELLNRLVALNAERAAEEARGQVRWLRPEFQHPQATAQVTQQIEADLAHDSALTLSPKERAKKTPWPAELPAQIRALADLISASTVPLTEAAIAAQFTGKGPWKKRLPQLLDTLLALGRVRATASGYAGA